MTIALNLVSPAVSQLALDLIRSQIARSGGWHASVPMGERQAMEAECAAALLRVALRPAQGVGA